MLPKLDAAFAWLWAPFLFAAVLSLRLALGAAVILLILVCTAVTACRPSMLAGDARAP